MLAGLLFQRTCSRSKTNGERIAAERSFREYREYEDRRCMIRETRQSASFRIHEWAWTTHDTEMTQPMNIAPNERRRSAVGAILNYGLTQEKRRRTKREERKEEKGRGGQRGWWRYRRRLSGTPEGGWQDFQLDGHELRSTEVLKRRQSYYKDSQSRRSERSP